MRSRDSYRFALAWLILNPPRDDQGAASYAGNLIADLFGRDDSELSADLAKLRAGKRATLENILDKN